MISAIAAIGKNRELGKDNKLLWNIPEDLKHFSQTTKGHPVIMGRNTWDSIGRALPGRTNIVLTRNPNFKPTGAIPVPTIDEAIAYAKSSQGADEIFIIGGAEVYKQALAYTDRLYITLIDQSFDADAFFPDYLAYTKVIQKSDVMQSGGLSYSYIILEK